ncbi:uncharacterized protein LOC110614873 [Manihot esculenta]|uniref:PGG domain-containing protein n=1 Tax=Manihot esculenta TaxID=3983 RepID=A0A2C9VVT0_MANES|nr:uncharacterized protein LOC110614873 [Manihot esculenta]OAY49442.1 hypothetical protein MANES_05G056701v8 [Manihot esculenta]
MRNNSVAARKPNPPPGNTWSHWFRYFQYDEENEKPSDTRNFLLVIAALIAAVTFQAGVNPPGGVWQDDKDGHHAGRAIYASQPEAYYVFVISNTLALSTSILMIVSLTYRFPLHFEIWVATISMIVTYGSAVFAVTPRENVKFRFLLLTAALPLLLRILIQVFLKFRTTYSKAQEPAAEETPDVEKPET